MKPVYQTLFGEPHGNCLQAAVASMLDLELNEVPNFMEADGDAWFDALTDFLSEHGLYALRLNAAPHCVPHGYHLMSGPSPRGPFWHELVGYRGKAVHDPYPGGECRLETVEEYMVFVALLNGGQAELAI